jgi:rSAM/selenodomain-associated transferase 2
VRISVIIPTLNEEELLPAALDSVLNQQPAPCEVIVADGGSADATTQVAGARASVVIGRPSIPLQKNLGASMASGDVLLFLHADCRLEDGALAELQRCCTGGVAGGAFTLQLKGNRPRLDQFLSLTGSWNARFSGFYLGDHGIFCRRRAFEKIGGFPDLKLMYEVPFMRKLRKEGALLQLKKRCFASARKFQQNGYVQTILVMRTLRAFYRLGLPYSRLEKLYLELKN